VPAGTRGKDVECKITNTHLTLKARGKVLIDGDLSQSVKGPESNWTVEDRKLVVIVLQKLKAHDSWQSAIAGEETPDAVTLDKMNKQMMLEKFQNENPAFDFSGAEFNGALPADPKNFMDNLKN
jgi:hypothetical protein